MPNDRSEDISVDTTRDSYSQDGDRGRGPSSATERNSAALGEVLKRPTDGPNRDVGPKKHRAHSSSTADDRGLGPEQHGSPDRDEGFLSTPTEGVSTNLIQALLSRHPSPNALSFDDQARLSRPLSLHAEENTAHQCNHLIQMLLQSQNNMSENAALRARYLIHMQRQALEQINQLLAHQSSMLSSSLRLVREHPSPRERLLSLALNGQLGGDALTLLSQSTQLGSSQNLLHTLRPASGSVNTMVFPNPLPRRVTGPTNFSANVPPLLHQRSHALVMEDKQRKAKRLQRQAETVHDTGRTVVMTQARAIETARLPPCEEGLPEPHTIRTMYALGIDEDANWLSEFHCFVRSTLVEIFRAGQDDCRLRNETIKFQQVGLRCRFCCHLPIGARASRSMAFPSSLRQIYQSFTMMLRDHFFSCDNIPTNVRDTYLSLKEKPGQGASDSKSYWVYSAMKIGLADSTDGIIITSASLEAGSSVPPFGANLEQLSEAMGANMPPIIRPGDRFQTSEFLFLLMSQAQMVKLTENERIGSRRNLPPGLPGIGCVQCCRRGRLGVCRLFPARRRTLATKVSDFYDHIRRCPLTADETKETLRSLQDQLKIGYVADQGTERDFYDRLWNRLQSAHGGCAKDGGV